MSRSGNTNEAEVYNQVLLMLGHEIFDPEVSRHVLVDQAFIVAGGEITMTAQSWIAGKLDQTKRSQILFMGRDDILNPFVVHNMPQPVAALPAATTPYDDSEVPF